MSDAAHAWGKVILLGEHAVVYGHPAIAAGIAPGVEARATPREAGVSLHVDPWNVHVNLEGGGGEHEMLTRALAALVQAGGGANAHVEAIAHLPAGGGLGSSAALGVAIARALWPAASLEAIDRAAHAFESVFHGTPSGLDAAVAARGGLVFFRRGQAPTPITAKAPFSVCIAQSGKSGSTHELVRLVAHQRERNPEATLRTLVGIGELVGSARVALEDGDWVGLGKLMDLNQILLASLLVSTPELEELCRIARDAGALGAKLTGAGGGGAVVALAPEDPERVLRAWSAVGVCAKVAQIA